MLTTRSGAYISRFSDFCVHDDNNNDNDDDTTDHFTPVHVRGVIIPSPILGDTSAGRNVDE